MKHLLLTFILFSAFATQAQLKLESLDECLEYIRLHNLALKNESLNQEISGERVKSAWSALLPQLKAFGTLDDNISLPVSLVPAQFLGGQPGEYAKVQFGTRYSATYGLEASLPLVNVSSWKNVKAAGYGEAAANYQYQYQEEAILEQAVAAYYFALLSREAMLLNRELVNVNDSLLQVAEVRFNNGIIEPLDFNRIKSIFLESQSQLRESEGMNQRNILALKALMGMDEKDSLQLTEQIVHTITRQNEPNTLKVSFDHTPRYKFSSLKSLQSETDWKRQRAKVLPELSLIARYSRQSFSSKLDMFSGSQPWFDVGVVGLRAEWNLFTGLNRQSSIRQASLQSQIARQESENSALQTQKELNELEVNHEVAAYGLARYAEHFQLNRMNHQVALEKYNNGLYTLDQFIIVYQESVRSQNQYLTKLASYLVYDSIIAIKNKYQVN